MQYAILCYNDEDIVWSWSQEEDKAVMDRLAVVNERLTKAGRMPLPPMRATIVQAPATTAARTASSAGISCVGAVLRGVIARRILIFSKLPVLFPSRCQRHEKPHAAGPFLQVTTLQNHLLAGCVPK
jgi:hypothetical protein